MALELLSGLCNVGRLQMSTFGQCSLTAQTVIVAGETSGGLDGYSNAGGSDIFIIKLNSGGTWQWTLQTGSSSDDTVSCLHMDSAGAILVSGETQGDLSGNVNAGGNDAYVMKVNGAGSLLWTVQRGFSGLQFIAVFFRV